METLKPTDICGICMDENNKEFLYKTCCTFLICRVCFNSLEVEAFPKTSTCPGCRKDFCKLSLTAVVIDNVNVPLAPCKAVCKDENPDDHIKNCLRCLQLIVNGNNWFEDNVAKKYTSLKRKYESCQDEVYARNQRIYDLTFENRNLKTEIGLRNHRIRILQTFLLRREDPNSNNTASATATSNVSTVISHLRRQQTAEATTLSAETASILETPPTPSESDNFTEFESLIFDSSSEERAASPTESPQTSPAHPTPVLTPERQPAVLTPPVPRILRTYRRASRLPRAPAAQRASASETNETSGSENLSPPAVLRRSRRIQLFSSSE